MCQHEIQPLNVLRSSLANHLFESFAATSTMQIDIIVYNWCQMNRFNQVTCFNIKINIPFVLQLDIYTFYEEYVQVTTFIVPLDISSLFTFLPLHTIFRLHKVTSPFQVALLQITLLI